MQCLMGRFATNTPKIARSKRLETERFCVCGAIDGKHIHIIAPANSGTMFFNYLKTFSIILLDVCDANKNFVYVDIGAYGGQSDGGVLSYSTLGKMLEENTLNLRPIIFAWDKSKISTFHYWRCCLSIGSKYTSKTSRCWC